MVDMKKRGLEGKMKGKNPFHEAARKCLDDFKKQYKG
jgi:hypothetical protein